jgi:hypothetical protein
MNSNCFEINVDTSFLLRTSEISLNCFLSNTLSSLGQGNPSIPGYLWWLSFELFILIQFLLSELVIFSLNIPFLQNIWAIKLCGLNKIIVILTRLGLLSEYLWYFDCNKYGLIVNWYEVLFLICFPEIAWVVTFLFHQYLKLYVYWSVDFHFVLILLFTGKF